MGKVCIPTKSLMPLAAMICFMVPFLYGFFGLHNFNIGYTRLLDFKFMGGDILAGLTLLLSIMILIFTKRNLRFLIIPVGLITVFELLNRFLSKAYETQDGYIFGVVIQGFFYLTTAILFTLTVLGVIKNRYPLLINLGVIIGLLILLETTDCLKITSIAEYTADSPVMSFRIGYTAEIVTYFLGVLLLASGFRFETETAQDKLLKVQKVSLFFACLYTVLFFYQILFSSKYFVFDRIYFPLNHWPSNAFYVLHILGSFLLIGFILKLQTKKSLWMLVPLVFITVDKLFNLPNYGLNLIKNWLTEGIPLDLGFNIIERWLTAGIPLALMILFVLTAKGIIRKKRPLMVSCVVIMGVCVLLQVIILFTMDWGPQDALVDGDDYSGPAILYNNVNLTPFLSNIALTLAVTFASFSLIVKRNIINVKTDEIVIAQTGEITVD